MDVKIRFPRRWHGLLPISDSEAREMADQLAHGNSLEVHAVEINSEGMLSVIEIDFKPVKVAEILYDMPCPGQPARPLLQQPGPKRYKYFAMSASRFAEQAQHSGVPFDDQLQQVLKQGGRLVQIIPAGSGGPVVIFEAEDTSAESQLRVQPGQIVDLSVKRDQYQEAMDVLVREASWTIKQEHRRATHHSTADFQIRESVIYKPMHADSLTHKDCQHGAVASKNAGTVYVRFKSHIAGCLPRDLFKISDLTAEEQDHWNLRVGPVEVPLEKPLHINAISSRLSTSGKLTNSAYAETLTTAECQFVGRVLEAAAEAVKTYKTNAGMLGPMAKLMDAVESDIY